MQICKQICTARPHSVAQATAQAPSQGHLQRLERSLVRDSAQLLVQVAALTADAHRAAGNLRAAVQCYEQSLATLATSGHDEGSAASKTRARLVDTLLEGGDAERALAVVEGMLSYARASNAL